MYFIFRSAINLTTDNIYFDRLATYRIDERLYVEMSRFSQYFTEFLSENSFRNKLVESVKKLIERKPMSIEEELKQESNRLR